MVSVPIRVVVGAVVGETKMIGSVEGGGVLVGMDTGVVAGVAIDGR